MESSWSGHHSNDVTRPTACSGWQRAVQFGLYSSPGGRWHSALTLSARLRGGTQDRIVCLISPPVMGPAYFREAAEAIGATAGGPPDRARMAEIFQRHGMAIVAPSLAK